MPESGLIDLGHIRESAQPASPIDTGLVNVDMIQRLGPDETKPKVEIALPDGQVVIQFGKPAQDSTPLHDAAFEANLALHMGETDLNRLADELILGIEADNDSRREWLEERAEGIRLMALKIERPSSSSAGAGAGVDNTSRSRDTLILEAVIRGQANASAELLPADGPVKITNKMGRDLIEDDDEAQSLEDDMNYWLTEVASEYFPDTEKMLLWTFMGGSGFKKVYRCPLRQRPVSESVDAADLIISNQATDIANADRVTFQTRMLQSTMKRMQYLKVYRDVALGQPNHEGKTAVEEAKEEITGVTVSQRPEDTPFTIWECYCKIDLPGDEHKKGGEPTGLPRPYKITIDKTSRQILEIRRNWRKGDKLERPREVFVKFPYVPGMGFYDLGLIHLAGNPTVALTAMLRLMIDNGIYANFPGGVAAKGATKQNTMDLACAPGQFQIFDTSGVADGDIRKAVMPLPYKEFGPGLMNLFKEVQSSGQRVAGTAEVAVGEGRADAPVGTTLALIEQATKVLNAVHKRLHRSQAKEFQLLRELFREYPEDFIAFNDKRDSNWDKERLLAALENFNLMPRADPNTSSELQRIGRAQALYQMASAQPSIYNVPNVQKYVIRQGLKIPDPQEFIQQAPAQQQPDLKGQSDMLGAQADLIDAQTKAGKLQFDIANSKTEDQNRDQDRNAELKVAEMRLEGEELKSQRDNHADLTKTLLQHGHERNENAADRHADALSALTPRPGNQ